ncbi:creatininase family protein [Dethiosulfatarculus sandiegensis]|uniref:Creatinine amidohydrolase n=1 Tax=Dethiosulfatarculus sandiegensis TaxID=1429043 RepID=A0A0D2HM13_9BACT|nr:creatininase family protein [Dethiosulfatarculus sandiegensis]KIX11633.1 creatinine amidohydrolase [Dethiosulfatarculus sandiegensis]
MFLQNITMPEFSRALIKTQSAILPVGVLEQHGPHLPLGLDAMHATMLARRTAELHPCLVAPPLNYGLCRSTSQHPGTVGISANTLKMNIHDISLGFYGQGIKTLTILTGHAGGTHQAALLDSAEEVLKETNLEIAVICVLDLFDQATEFLECKGDSHAGEVETSLAMHLWPELVKGSAKEEYPTYPRFILVRDKVGHWPGGVWGDPTKASREKGEKIFELEAENLVKVIKDLEKRAA